jgi:cytochrome P450
MLTKSRVLGCINSKLGRYQGLVNRADELRCPRFREWATEYGPVFSLKLGPANVVVLCDRKAIHKLLVEKGAIYSDRPDSYVGHLLTKGDHLATAQMDPVWREKRKVIAHNFSPKQLDEKHFRVQEAE